MTAEVGTDAPKSFCDAPGGTGHRDMARFLNRKSQRHCRLTLADTYYGKMTYDGLCRLAWADVRSPRENAGLTRKKK